MVKNSQTSAANAELIVEQGKGSELFTSTRAWFFVTIIYLILDYSRIYVQLHLGVLRPLMIIIFVLSFFLVIGRKYYLSKSKQTTLLWLFIALLAAYVPFARNNHYAYITFKSQLLYMPFILSLIVCVNSFERLKKLIFVCICLEIYIAFYAMTHAGFGPGNYFADENDLAIYINMWLPFCYFLFFAEKKLGVRFVYLTGLLIGLLSIVVSFSRGGFIGLLAVCGTVWLISKRKVINLVVLSLLAGLIVFYAGEKYWAEMSTIANTESGTTKERIESWKSAWRMFLDNPLGVGGNNFQVRFVEYQTDYFKKGMWGRVVHSLWFTLISELGIFGVLIYIGLLYYNLKDSFILKNVNYGDAGEDQKYLNFLGKAFISSFAGYFASGTFLSVLYYAHYWYMTSMIVATTNVANSFSLNGSKSQ